MSNDCGDGRLGSDGVCGDADGLSAPSAIALTPDGRWVFVASRSASSLTWFARDPATGALEQRGCLESFAWPGERCTTSPLLVGASGVAVSADGTFVFVSASTSGAITTCRRDTGTGALRQLACAASRVAQPGACTPVTTLDGIRSIVLRGDGRNLYVAGNDSHSIAVFASALEVAARARLIRPTRHHVAVDPMSSPSRR
ncbi:MAG TPA: beta-propeller fold lactonase family protein [Solirubrobacter sp.]